MASSGEEQQHQPALQVIILGAGGGPKEDNVTAFLVRSTAAGWRKGCLLAVDAGVHLASITNILENHERRTETDEVTAARAVILEKGPFEGLQIPHNSAKANAAFITRSLVDTYLITHPHLDHISGFVVNTAALPGLRPKRLAGLPSTIEAFKNHIFNNIIWPNLSDENGGAGLVTYMRLIEGGSPALGHGAGKGYVEVSEGLGVKAWPVSHGHCMEPHSHHNSNPLPPIHEASPRSSLSLHSSANRPRLGRSSSTSSFHSNHSAKDKLEPHVYDSSTYFIRDVATGKEIIIFGDVEPDSLSFFPRNKRIWSEAAPKIVAGSLTGIFIECSYDDSREVDALFGHLAPRYLIEELKVLAEEVRMLRESLLSGSSPQQRKRKASSNGSSTPKRKQPARNGNARHKQASPDFENAIMDAEEIQAMEIEQGIMMPSPECVGLPWPRVLSSTSAGDALQLKGVKIIAIHVKDKLDDGPDIGDIILSELRGHEEKERLGCEFIIARSGQSIYF